LLIIHSTVSGIARSWFIYHGGLPAKPSENSIESSGPAVCYTFRRNLEETRFSGGSVASSFTIVKQSWRRISGHRISAFFGGGMMSSARAAEAVAGKNIG
jgi:hypothetical protein